MTRKPLPHRAESDVPWEARALRGPRGPVECLVALAPGARRAVLLLGGGGGAFDTPAVDLYPRLCRDLPARGISTLQVRCRDHHDLDASRHDVDVGLRFLSAEGVAVVALVGWSFGGAVVIGTAARAPIVRGVVTLATQRSGTDDVGTLGPRCALLAIHGLDDDVLPPAGSIALHAAALEPKRLMLLLGAGHALDEVRDEVRGAVLSFLQEALAEGAPPLQR